MDGLTRSPAQFQALIICAKPPRRNRGTGSSEIEFADRRILRFPDPPPVFQSRAFARVHACTGPTHPSLNEFQHSVPDHPAFTPFGFLDRMCPGKREKTASKQYLLATDQQAGSRTHAAWRNCLRWRNQTTAAKTSARTKPASSVAGRAATSVKAASAASKRSCTRKSPPA